MLILFKDLRLTRWVFNVDSVGRASATFRDSGEEERVAAEGDEIRAGRKGESKFVGRKN